MTEGTGSHRAIPGQREQFADQISKATVLAEARLLVARLDQYFELMDSWYADAEEGDSDDGQGDQ